MVDCDESDNCFKTAQHICEDTKPQFRMHFLGREGEEEIRRGQGGEHSAIDRVSVQCWQRTLKPEACHALVEAHRRSKK